MKTFRILTIHKIDQVLKTYQFLRNLKLTVTVSISLCFRNCFRNCKQVFHFRQNETCKLFTYHPGHLNIDLSNEPKKNALLGTFKQMT